MIDPYTAWMCLEERRRKLTIMGEAIGVKAPRRVPSSPENPQKQELDEFEAEGTRILTRALSRWLNDLFRDTDDSTVVLQRMNDPEIQQRVIDAVVSWLQPVAEAGAERGREQVEKLVFGTKAGPFDIDWTLANNRAAQWALDYAGRLVRQMTDSRRQRLRREIANFVRNGETITQLKERLRKSGLFGETQAQMIAVTETTRAYAEGNQAAWEQSRVINAREWNTNNDELVCPICGPRHNMVRPLGESFDGIDKPPAHPNCRCWLSPVADFDDERFAGGVRP